MAGGNASFSGIVSTSIFKVFDLEVGRTGLTEKEAKNAGIDYAANTIDSISRSKYYPGASPLKIKLIAEKEVPDRLGVSPILNNPPGPGGFRGLLGLFQHSPYSVTGFSTSLL